MRCARVAGCEVVVLHPAKFGNGRVRYSGVTPCDLFLIILSKSGGNAKVTANVLGVSFAVPWIGKPKHPIIALRLLSWMERVHKPVEPKSEEGSREVELTMCKFQVALEICTE